MNKIMIIIGCLCCLAFPLQILSATSMQPDFEEVLFEGIHVRIYGHGKSNILLIPGFACSGEVWNEVLVNVPNSFTTHVITFPGFAGIDPTPDSDFEFWIKIVARYIEAHNGHPFTVIGHSMGGSLALALAADYSFLVNKILVVDALPCLAALNNATYEAPTVLDCAAIINYLTRLSDADFRVQQENYVQNLVSSHEVRSKIVNWSCQTDRYTFANMFCQLTNLDLRPRLIRVSVPVVVLLEPYFASFSSQINAQFSNLNQVEIKYASKGLHFIMYDDRDWFNKEFTAFLDFKL